jgi:hypothetical protein
MSEWVVGVSRWGLERERGWIIKVEAS